MARYKPSDLTILGVDQGAEQDSGKWGNRVSAGVDSYQGNMWGLVEAATGSDWARQRRRDNELDAQYSRELARRAGAISAYKDIGSFGDAVDYVGGLATDSLPYAAETVIGGVLTGGTLPILRTGGTAALRTAINVGRAADAGVDAARAAQAAEKALRLRATMGGVAASYPSAVGDILQNQREASRDGETTDLGAAAAGGLPYAALNAFGVEGALARRTAARGLGQGGLRDWGRSIGVNLGVEGASETGQEMVNQRFGRMVTDPNETMFSPSALDRYGESFVGGAALGGLMGGAGGWRPSQEYLDGRRMQGAADREFGAETLRQQNLLEAASRPQFELAPSNGLPLPQRTAPDLGGADWAEGGIAGEQYDLFNPNGTPTYGANPEGPMSAVDAVRSRMEQGQPLNPGVVGAMAGVSAPPTPAQSRARAMDVSVAANEPGQRFSDENGLERIGTAWDDQQRQLGLLQEIQKKAADMRAAQERARAAVGEKATPKAIDMFGELERLVEQGAIGENEFSTYAAMLSTNQYGKVRKAIDAVQQPVVPGAAGQSGAAVEGRGNQSARGTGAARPVAGSGMPGENGTAPAVAAPGREVAPVEAADGLGAPRTGPLTVGRDLSPEELAVAQPRTIRRDWGNGKVEEVAAPKRDNSVEMAEDVEFRRSLAARLKSAPEKDKELLSNWLGVRIKGDDLEIDEAGGDSMEVLGRSANISKQAIKKRIDAALARMGASGSISPKLLRERLGLSLSGTTLDELQRNVDAAPAAAAGASEAELAFDAVVEDRDGNVKTTSDFTPAGAEQEVTLADEREVYGDDVGTAEDGTDADTVESAAESALNSTVLIDAFDGSLWEALTGDVKAGRIVATDVSEAATLWAETKRSFDPSWGSLATSHKLAMVRTYARARLAGDPVVLETKRKVYEAEQAGLARRAADPRAGSRAAEGTGGSAEAAADGGVRGDGDIGAQVPGNGQQEQPGRPAVTVTTKKRRAFNREVLDGPKFSVVDMTERRNQQLLEEEIAEEEREFQEMTDAADSRARGEELRVVREEALPMLTALAPLATKVRALLDGPPVSAGLQEGVALRTVRNLEDLLKHVQQVIHGNPSRYGNVDNPTWLGAQNARYVLSLLSSEAEARADLQAYIDAAVATRDRLKRARHKYAAEWRAELDRILDGNVVALKRSIDQAGGSTVASVKKELKKLGISDTYGRVTVVQTVADLPVGAKAAIEKESGSGGKVQAFVLGGKAYLVADNIAPGNARAVFMHEVGSHLGLDNLLTKAQYDNLVRKLLSWADKNDGSMESRLARRAIERTGAAGTPDVDLHSEILAYFVEEAVKAGIDPTAMKYNSDIARWFAELIRAMKQALAKLKLFNANGLTPQDVVDLAYGAAKIELETPTDGDVADELLASRIVRDEQGNREYDGDSVRIAFPQPVDRIEVIPVGGQRVLNYAIMPADSFGVLGHIDLLVDANGVPESLLDIEVYERGRGHGERAVEALLNAYPGRDINISNIVPEAQGFWEKLGVPAQNLEAGAAYDGTLNAEIVQQAKRDRAQAAARRDAQGRGGANQGADAGAAQGVRGAVRFSVSPAQSNTSYEAFRNRVEQLNRSAPPPVRNAASAVAEGFKKLGLRSMTNFQIAEQWGDMWATASDRIGALKRRASLATQMGMHRNELSQRITSVAEQWDKLDANAKQLLNGVMQDATMSEIHPDAEFGTGVNAHVKDRAKYEALKSRYNAMPQEARKVYQDAKAALEQQWKERNEGFKVLVDNAITDRLAAAMEAGEPDERLDEIKADRARFMKQYEDQLGKVRGPYFPLMRFGDFIAIGESAELQAAKDAFQSAEGGARKAAKDAYDKLRKDPKHYRVSTHDTLAEMKDAMRAMESVDLQARQDRTGAMASAASRDSTAILERYKEALRHNLKGTKELEPAIKALTDVFMSNLPEMHALRRQAERQGIAGADANMLRAFAAAGQQGAFYASRMKYGGAIAQEMRDVRKQAKANGGDQTMLRVVQEMEQRQALDMTYTETPVQDFLTTAGYTFYLGASPAFLVMNLMQPAMVSLPSLAGKHGLAASFRALGKAYTDALTLLKAARMGDDGKWDFWRAIDDSALGKGQPGGDTEAMSRRRGALRELLKSGVIDEGQQHELGMFASDSSRTMARLSRGIGWAAQQVELVNRLSTALAAYDLEFAKGGTHEAAIEYARAQTIRTQMDYSSESTARIMREGGGVPFAKLLFQFRRFQQGMLYLLGDNLNKLRSGPDRAEAAKTLAYLTATAGVAAGAMGLPFMSTILWAMSLGDDEDDPRGKPEVRLRNAIYDMFGKEMGDVVSKGLPAMLGVDMSKRIGMGDLLSPFPMAKLDGKAKDDAKEILAAAAGPAFSMVTSMWSGVHELAAGNYAKAWQQMTPKMLADLGRSVQFATDGMVDSKGNPVPVPLDGGDVVARALGFSPMSQADYYEGTQAIRSVQQGMNNVKSEIGQSYRKALRTGDYSDVRAQIAEWNAKHPTDRITAKQEVQWRREATRGAKEANAAGIRVDRAAKPYAEVARFAN